MLRKPFQLTPVLIVFSVLHH